MMAELPLRYGKVVGRFLANVNDGPDLDGLPEFLPLTGTVRFTAAVSKVSVTTAGAATTYVQLPEHYECSLDEFGYLTWRGQRGVRLVAPGPEMNPSNWTWSVSFDLRYEDRPIPMAPFDFQVPEWVPGPDVADPDSGSTGLVDLTLVAPSPGSQGTAVVVGPPGTDLQIDGQVDTYAELPVSASDGAQIVVRADGLLYLYRAADGGWPAEGNGIKIRGPIGASSWDQIADRPSTFPPAIGPNSNTAVAGDDPRMTNARPPTPHSHGVSEISDVSALGATLAQAADPAAARTILGTITADDVRLSDVRTPTAAGQAYDITFKSHMGTRIPGPGNVLPEGIRVERAIEVSAITFFGNSAGSGDLIVELRNNGATVTGTTTTVPQTHHVLGETTTGSWLFEPGDRITVHIVNADNPGGLGLQASIKAVTR